MKNLIFMIVLFGFDQAFAQTSQTMDSIRCLLENYQYQQSLDAINNQLKISNSNTLYIYKGLALKGILKYPDAIESFQTALKNDSNNVRVIIELSNTYKLLGDYNKALTYLVAANETNPNPALLTEIAAALFSMEAYADALTIYNELITQDFANAFLLKNTAKCYDNMEKTDSAIFCYEKTIELNTSDFLTIIRLGNLYIKRKDYKKGIEITEMYRLRDTTNIKINRLNAYFYLLDKDYKTARNKFTRCMENNDTVDFVFKYLGTSYFKLERYDTAKIYLEKAYFKDSLDAQTCYFLGMACSGSYYKELGIRYINKAIALMNPDPEYMSGVYKNLAEACNGFYKYEEGLDALLKAYDLNPTDTLLLYKTGIQYEWLKDKDLALKYYSDFMSTRSPKKENAQKGNATIENRGYIEVSYYDIVEKRIIELRKETAKEND